MVSDQILHKVKVPISSFFLFFYQKVHIFKWTFSKKFFDLNETRIFYEFLNSINCKIYLVQLFRWSPWTTGSLWRTLRNGLHSFKETETKLIIENESFEVEVQIKQYTRSGRFIGTLHELHTMNWLINSYMREKEKIR